MGLKTVDLIVTVVNNLLYNFVQIYWKCSFFIQTTAFEKRTLGISKITNVL